MPGEIKTEIDIILQLLRERGKVKLSEISREFGIDEEILEKWAEILDYRGVAKIEYGIDGTYLGLVKEEKDKQAGEILEDIKKKRALLLKKEEQIRKKLLEARAKEQEVSRIAEELSKKE
ncbi:MAG: hypothetical protein QXP42_05430, partial [Candidatus Micrarchaeia archaeon]